MATQVLPPVDVEASAEERAVQVATLTDRFVIMVSAAASVADVREVLCRDRFLQSTTTVTLFTEEERRELCDNELISELPADTTLLCIAVDSVTALEEKLKEVQSPGSETQKYLRSYVGVEAGDARVLRSVWVLATMAKSADMALFVSSDACDAKGLPCLPQLDQVGGAAIMMLNCIWSSWRRSRHTEPTSSEAIQVVLTANEKLTAPLQEQLLHASLEDLEKLLAPHYSPEAHRRLLAWLLQSDGTAIKPGGRAPRLRVALAEIDQILCRGAERLLAGGSGLPMDRQSMAYSDLLKVVACRPDVRCWA